MAAIQIFVRLTSDNTLVTVGPSALTRETATRFSPAIRSKLSEGTRGIRKTMVEFNEQDLSVFGANAVLQWMMSLNHNKPHQMTVQSPKIQSFDAAIYTYQAAHTLGISKFLRGSDVSNAIISHIDNSTVGVHEFSMVINRLSFAKGIVVKVMNHIMFRVEKGGEGAVPEFAEIKKFCEVAGLWEEMLAVKAKIKQKKKENKANAQAAAKAKAEVQYEEDFPKLP